MIKRILIIDDEIIFRKLFTRALEDTPYKVDTAESGEKGFELLKKLKYDLIFLDLYMPGISGIDVLREIRKTDEEVPIHIVSAFYKEFLEEINLATRDGLKFEITHKSITLNQIVSIAKETLEGGKVLHKINKDMVSV